MRWRPQSHDANIEAEGSLHRSDLLAITTIGMYLAPRQQGIAIVPEPLAPFHPGDRVYCSFLSAFEQQKSASS